MSSPSFSIIVPTFNAAATLAACLESIVAQRYPALEIIVIDALSMDETPAILERFRPYLSRVVREPDSGQAEAINKGLSLAKGDIVSWLCADDELLPGALECVAGLFREDPKAEVVIGACERVFADGTTFVTQVPQDAWQKIGRINVIDQPSVFWRAPLQLKLGPLDCTYRLAFDWDLWCRMAAAGASLKITDTVLSRYYFSVDNKTSTAGSGHARESFRVIRDYGPLGGGAAYIYRFLYNTFDLHGCYDQPPTCGALRGRLFMLSMAVLITLFGKELIHGYNWHFASCQERGLKWW